MFHTALTENPTKKPTNWKKTLNFVIIKKYFSGCLKNSGYKTKLQYQQTKENIKAKGKENVTLFGSIHHTARPLKPTSGEYSSN